MAHVYTAMDIHTWISRFNRNVWAKLSKAQQNDLQRRFGIAYNPDDAKDTLVPKSFVIAAAFRACEQRHDTLQDYCDLIQTYPGKDDKQMQKLTFDEDGWGTLRTNPPNIGLFPQFSDKKARYFETLLASTHLLHYEAKLEVVKQVAHLNKKDIKHVVRILKEDALKMPTWWDCGNYDRLIREVKRVEQEWTQIVEYYNLYIKKHRKPTIRHQGLPLDQDGDLSPQGIVQKLGEKMIVGQDEALRSVAVMLYYHNKQRKAYLTNKHIEPMNETLLLTGPTGSGKSYIVEQACQLMKIPFVHIDASSFVQSGIVGFGPNDILKTLLRNTKYNVEEAETAVVILDEIDKLLETHYGESVMFQLLRFIEGAEIPIEQSQHNESNLNNIRSISTKHICFILAGSFQSLIDSFDPKIDALKPWKALPRPTLEQMMQAGFPKELLGRIREIVTLKPLRREDFRRILLESKNSPIAYYRDLLRRSGRDYTPTPQEIEAVIEEAMQLPFGVRGLKQAVYQRIYKDRLFDAPREKE